MKPHAYGLDTAFEATFEHKEVDNFVLVTILKVTESLTGRQSDRVSIRNGMPDFSTKLRRFQPVAL